MGRRPVEAAHDMALQLPSASNLADYDEARWAHGHGSSSCSPGKPQLYVAALGCWKDLGGCITFLSNGVQHDEQQP